jgi:hypothetical protein
MDGGSDGDEAAAAVIVAGDGDDNFDAGKAQY